ncbi:MAG: PDR/VanB family oxidoreductase [Rhizobacter sp.]
MSSSSTLTVRVESKADEALDVRTFELVDVEGRPVPAFSAGSHIDVHLPNGITRQYSLCNHPAESHRYQIGVLRDPASRGGSSALYDAIQVGDILTISAPRNHFPLAHEAERSLLLAGGIGITPILCMAERLAIVGAEFELHYATRSRERTAFYDRMAGSAYASRVHFYFDDGDPAQKLDLAALLTAPHYGTHLYVCGPKGFMDAVLGTARSRGWSEARLHYEFFSAELVRSDSDVEFRVKLASSGRVVTVPRDWTVVEALAGAGVEVQTSCEQGVCGTCLTRVLEGTPEHRDMYLMPDEQARNDQFTPCCSRSKSPVLVLDL